MFYLNYFTKCNTVCVQQNVMLQYYTKQYETLHYITKYKTYNTILYINTIEHNIYKVLTVHNTKHDNIIQNNIK